MRKIRSLLLLLLSFACLLPLAADEAPTITPGAGTGPAITPAPVAEKPLYAHSYALLIGIDAYQHVPALDCAVNDVTALREELIKDYGFPPDNITTLTDEQATKEGIMNALGALADNRRLAHEDRVLIYFSGHGQTVQTPEGGAKGFLIPVDASVDLHNLQNPAQYVKSCLPMNNIWDTLDLCPAKHVLLIADACYSGLLAKPRALDDTRHSPALATLAALPARQVITAGRANEEAAENAGWGHGALTKKLLEQLHADAATPGAVVTTLELFAQVRRGVQDLTNGKQTPQLADKDTEGEFLFVVPVAGTKPVPTTPDKFAVVDTNAKIQITTTPAQATVYLDGTAQTEQTPCTLTVDLGIMRAKMVEVGVSLAGYKDAVRDVTLERGKTAGMELTLEMKAPELPVDPANIEQTHVNLKDGAELVLIPAGEFTMGSAHGVGGPDEHPAHKVYLDSYSIYKNDVTVAQYRKFCEATGRTMPVAPDWGWIDNHPIVNVTWDDATAYAHWAGAALPTEAEWEKAARGTDGREYPWGNDWDAAKCSNGVATNPRKTSAVGSFPAGASPYGVLDMEGNVWQWCADWYGDDYYKDSPLRNPIGPDTGTMRVLRGGSWCNGITVGFRAAYRDRGIPIYRGGDGGFRCVCRSPGP